MILHHECRKKTTYVAGLKFHIAKAAYLRLYRGHTVICDCTRLRTGKQRWSPDVQ